MLTKDQEKSRLDITCTKYFLSLYEEDLDEFMCRVANEDETWVHHFDHE